MVPPADKVWFSALCIPRLAKNRSQSASLTKQSPVCVGTKVFGLFHGSWMCVDVNCVAALTVWKVELQRRLFPCPNHLRFVLLARKHTIQSFMIFGESVRGETEVILPHELSVSPPAGLGISLSNCTWNKGSISFHVIIHTYVFIFQCSIS